MSTEVCYKCEIELDESNIYKSPIGKRGRPQKNPICVSCKSASISTSLKRKITVEASPRKRLRSLSKEEAEQLSVYATTTKFSMEAYEHKLKMAKLRRGYDNSINKKIFNKKVVKSLNLHKTSLTRDILLDSKDMNTSNAIISYAGVKKEDIETIEHNSEIHNIHKEFGVKSYLGEFDDFVSKKTDVPCRLLCADLQGILQTVGQSILKAIKNGYIGSGSILFVTMTKGHGEKDTKFNIELTKWIILLNQLSLDINLSVKQKWTYEYKHMYSTYFYFE